MDQVTPRPSPELRCAYCHGDAVGALACAGCGTLTHPVCRTEAGGCVSLGCGERARVRSPAPKARPARPVAWSAVLAVVAVVIVVFGGVLFEGRPRAGPTRVGDRLDDVATTLLDEPPASEARAHVKRGNASANAGDFTAAAASFDEALRLEPELVEARIARARVRAELGEHDGAIADCDEALRLQPGREEVYARRGNSRATKGDEEGALADFETSLRLKPIHHAHSGRGKLRLARGALEDARADFDAAIALMARCSPCHWNRAEARALLGDLDGASDDFERSSDISGRDGRVGLWSVALGGDPGRLTRYLDRTDWMGSVARLWSGQGTLQEVLATADRGVSEARQSERLCEVLAIVGAHAERAGDLVLAREAYTICVTKGAEGTFELRFSKARLAALR